ncbi:MAG: type II toxin-antitoxin system VapC family toxin [Betaproteobacteria bacterium]
MTRYLVDTGAWYALVDRKDPDHAAVSECLRERAGQLVTTNFIFDESVTLIRYRLGSSAARTFGEQLLHGGAARLVAITRRDEARAWEIFARYRDKAFSYTDCTSFAAMRRLGIDTAVAIDDDFRAFGLACLP